MLEVCKAYRPSCCTTLPCELSFNWLRDAERRLKNPSQAGPVQMQAVVDKSLQHFTSEAKVCPFRVMYLRILIDVFV